MYIIVYYLKNNYYSFECGYKILLALNIGLKTENVKFPRN